jgi:hypothetical protein
MLAFAGTAQAQSPTCDRYRAELAALNRGAGSARTYEAAAQRQREEFNRLFGYYRSIGCGSASFFFRPPAECGPIAERLRVLQSNAAQLAARAVADPSANDARRRDLRAAIAQACDGDVAGGTIRAKGGSRLVCVRECDGYFFPLDSVPKSGASAEAMCRALCPSAEVVVFKAPKDGNIEEAVSRDGRPYMKLANALKYQKSYDASCSCRSPGESWAKTLQKAERMLDRRRGDIIVTAEKAEELSRAKVKAAKRGRKNVPAEPGIVPAAVATNAALDPETTGSIKPAASSGPRVIAPDLIPVPIRNH